MEEYDLKEPRSTVPAAIAVMKSAHVGPQNYAGQLTFSAGHINVFVINTFSNEAVVHKMRQLMKQCCTEHPNIEIDDEVVGGLPCIRDSRISVDYVLDRILVHGSIKNVVRRSLPQMSEEQIKSAVAYARDFMEMACAQLETNDR